MLGVCRICGKMIDEYELTWDTCEECMENVKTYDNCVCCGEENRSRVELNGFITSCLDETEMEEILLEAICHSRYLSRYINDYATDNLYEIIEMKEEEKENDRPIERD